MKKWAQLKKIQDDLAAEKISETEALDLLRATVELHSKNSSSIEYQVFMNEICKLKILIERMNAILEENKCLEAHNNILFHYALMSDEDLRKNRKYIIKIL